MARGWGHGSFIWADPAKLFAEHPEWFSEVQGRAVSVDSRGIQEVLRKIYGAGALADELLGVKAEVAKAGK